MQMRSTISYVFPAGVSDSKTISYKRDFRLEGLALEVMFQYIEDYNIIHRNNTVEIRSTSFVISIACEKHSLPLPLTF